jgi:hypothetical protein
LDHVVNVTGTFEFLQPCFDDVGFWIAIGFAVHYTGIGVIGDEKERPEERFVPVGLVEGSSEG